jgi:hypothetical protein
MVSLFANLMSGHVSGTATFRGVGGPPAPGFRVKASFFSG